ncbi:unnamed protein product [Macrosiphum euphorbiae]|uniref:Reverse transcriptase domain-containing protein n=1 Tax=Macrosiphum euphorbiae TaxID=13131 RepID=A0AAV0WLF5_9HEMI|nr:unnamed protein product [Macrosiphum euphorbiae]
MHNALNWKEKKFEKYVIAVFLYILGAFDCLWWAQLVIYMRNAGCRSGLVKLTKIYLYGRRAVMQFGNQTVTLTKGCPQGSEYGPDLWKLAVNPLLSVDPPTCTELIAYADDLLWRKSCRAIKSWKRITK